MNKNNRFGISVEGGILTIKISGSLIIIIFLAFFCVYLPMRFVENENIQLLLLALFFFLSVAAILFCNSPVAREWLFFWKKLKKKYGEKNKLGQAAELKGVILYIVPKIIHKSGKEVQLILWWLRDRLIIKDINSPAYDGLHYFPDDSSIGGESLCCPTIDLVAARGDGMGWNIQGETAEGKKFELEIMHDFVNGGSSFNQCYLV